MVNIRSATGPAQVSPATDRGLTQLIQRGNLLPIVSGFTLEELVVAVATIDCN